MQDKVKELLKEEIKSVNQSRTKVITGVVLLLADIVLLALSFLSIYTLILTLPLLFVVRKQIMDYRMNKMVLLLTRYIIDDEFANEFDKQK